MDTKTILLRIDTVMERVPYKRSSIYAKVKKDKFPMPIVKKTGFVAWKEEDINLYIEYLQIEDDQLKWSEFIKNINN